MILYHGLPITPVTAAVKAVQGGHAFVSYAHPEQLGVAAEFCASFALDNGAFPAWRAKRPIKDWRPFYEWAADAQRLPGCDFAVIPDVIDGTEAENDRLISDWPLGRHFGAPVWHMHESLGRLAQLVNDWPRVYIGSSGEFDVVGTPAWWGRMELAMLVACDVQGRPVCRLHGLRMLNPRVFTRLPLSSADSTNIGRNIGIDQAWKGTYAPIGKDARALALRVRMEALNGAIRWRKP